MKKLLTFLFSFTSLIFVNAQICGETDVEALNHQGPPQEEVEARAIQIVTEFLTAVKQGDGSKFNTLLHPELTWMQPGNNRVSGYKRSREEFFQMAGQMGELSAHTLALADIRFISANGNRVACLLHWKAAQPTGVVLDVENVDVYVVENGHIVSAVIYSSDIQKENTFWGKK